MKSIEVTTNNSDALLSRLGLYNGAHRWKATYTAMSWLPEQPYRNIYLLA